MTHNSDDRKEDQPNYARLFVVCSRRTREEDLRKLFEEYGAIDDLHVPRDRTTGENKGYAYIKYKKTSSAALAIKALHLKSINGKPMKVMVAANKNESQLSDQYGDKFTRLFIKIPKEYTETDIIDKFSKFGQVQSVYILKDKKTNTSKGFAYVKYGEFYDAAIAFERCDKIYKAIFAAPKDLKRDRSVLEDESFLPHSQKRARNNSDTFNHQPIFEMNKFNAFTSIGGQEYRTICVKCIPIIPEKFIYQLCNIIPGLQKCQYSLDTYNGMCSANVTYEESKYAAYAVQKLNKFEFPSGEIISAKPDANPLAQVATDLTDIVNNFKSSVDSGVDLINLANAIEKASSLIKAAASGQIETKENPNYCNIPLPPPKPKSNTLKVAKRLFIICKPEPPPVPVLHDAFCRFGDLIGVSTFPNKTFGFVKYASHDSAQEAMNVLNGALICGMKLKVIEADEKPHCEDNTVKEEFGSSQHIKT
ncbi:RNA-binding protein 45 [Pieris brassicae]|uniref:RNA-binding protein 45 n=1 Tax=Pieris brassicae TaxID=7116 RepID=UPI001E660447|nr:RNA-binding protein 45 [Pieris brassicae]